jgi:hypothetical protein
MLGATLRLGLNVQLSHLVHIRIEPALGTYRRAIFVNCLLYLLVSELNRALVPPLKLADDDGLEVETMVLLD